MATRITYTAAEKKKLRAWTWTGNNVADSRAIKMARPQCQECQRGLDTEPQWWTKCTHDPYWSSQPKSYSKEEWVMDNETGEEVLKGTVKEVRRVRVPNIVQIPLVDRSNDGQGPQRFHDRKGFKYLPEVGLAPMCELHGCGKAWPTLAARDGGMYCSEGHARASITDREGKYPVVWVDPEIDTGSVRSLQADMMAKDI